MGALPETSRTAGPIIEWLERKSVSRILFVAGLYFTARFSFAFAAVDPSLVDRSRSIAAGVVVVFALAAVAVFTIALSLLTDLINLALEAGHRVVLWRRRRHAAKSAEASA